MFLSISLILIAGMVSGWLCSKAKLPPLIGMIAAGIILGPHVLNLIDADILRMSGIIRKAALIIILTRAGFGLDLAGLKKNGRPALLMCFLPASFEVAGVIIAARLLLGLTFTQAAAAGAVLAAVSPAVVVPRMVKLMEEGYGTKKGIPQLILAGASVDDVYVIVLFSAFTAMLQGEQTSVMSFVNIPVSVILGAAAGILTGTLLGIFFEKVNVRGTVKVFTVFGISLLLSAAEDHMTGMITFSSLIAVMCTGVGIKKRNDPAAEQIASKYSEIWIIGEIFLFVLVGAAVDIGYITHAGAGTAAVIVTALIFRMAGVWLCLAGTKLTFRERLFVMVAYTPKATVQAAIGGIPLSLGLSCGDTILTAAVLAIIITAPAGAFAIDNLYPKLLEKNG